MKMTSKVVPTTGTEESDKRSELTELSDAILTEMKRVPSVEELARFSNARLLATHIHWCWINYEYDCKLASAERNQSSAVVGEEVQALRDALAHSYWMLQNLFVAQNSRTPVLPDYRPLGWADVGDNMTLCLINCSEKDAHRRLLLASGTVTKRVAPVVADNGNITTLPYLSVHIADPESVGWPIDTCEYDLYSPYIMAPEDAEYFREHPSDLHNWLERCGELYSDFEINDELKRAFVEAFQM